MQQAMAALGNRYGLNGTPSMQQQTTKPILSTGKEPKESQERLLAYPPMVNPRRTPENIIRSIFVNESDYNDFVKHLGTCQKTHAEWDHYRQKIPDDLLAKFKMLLEACRENGFIGPRIIDGKMVFSQVLSKKRNRKESDQCTMCPNNIVSKTCNGRMFYNSKFQKIFEPCWTAKS